jgi:hypothetical protein
MAKQRYTILAVIIVWVMAGLACRLGPATPAPGATVPQNESPSVTAPQRETQAVQTQATQVQGFPLPSGVLIYTGGKVGITFYNAAGQVITELKTPGLQNPKPSEIHMAGTVSGQILTPLVFHAWEPQSRIKININDAINLMADVSDFFAMRGVPGQPILAYSAVSYDSGIPGITSKVYLGNLEQLTGGGGLIYTESSIQSYAVYPLAVNAEDNSALGFWFSRQAYGIGDAIFTPQKGLYYYDLATQNVSQVLDETHSPQGMSLDHHWVASNAWQGDHDIYILNVITTAEAMFPLLPASTDGAGFAVFSPDDELIAWMEASGAMMADVPDFHSLVRVGQTDSILVRDVPDLSFSAVIGTPVTWVEPVAWLDNSTILVQARGSNWTDAWVMKLDVITGNVSLFAAGTYMGLYYP